jgi:hypothetical protein
MARYIDADSLLKRMFPYDLVDKKQYALNAQAVYNVIESSSTADVVEVVRCKDCAVPHNKWLGCPNLNGKIPPPDFYCARGERKGGAE